MKEFVISEAKAETAVLVGLITKDQDEAKTKEYLDELEFLADTAGAVRLILRSAKMSMMSGWTPRMRPALLASRSWTSQAAKPSG